MILSVHHRNRFCWMLASLVEARGLSGWNALLALVRSQVSIQASCVSGDGGGTWASPRLRVGEGVQRQFPRRSHPVRHLPLVNILVTDRSPPLALVVSALDKSWIKRREVIAHGNVYNTKQAPRSRSLVKKTMTHQLKSTTVAGSKH
ncbi:hypothetical protein OG21DRAFT_1604272 [Imleria badia]|nr:hypothetical protein OG21DRAFT_1604272 [Imleria badia]